MRNMWYLTSVDLDEHVQPPFQLKTSNDVRVVANAYRISK